MKPFKKEHGFEFKNEKLYIYTMADERDAICNMKALKTLSSGQTKRSTSKCSATTLEFAAICQ